MADAPEVVKADGKIRGCWLDGAGDLVVATNRGAVGVLQRRRDGARTDVFKPFFLSSARGSDDGSRCECADFRKCDETVLLGYDNGVLEKVKGRGSRSAVPLGGRLSEGVASVAWGPSAADDWVVAAGAAGGRGAHDVVIVGRAGGPTNLPRVHTSRIAALCAVDANCLVSGGFDGRLQLYDGASGRLTRALSGTTPRQKWNDVCAAPALGGNLILATALVPDSSDDTGGYRVDVVDVRKAQPTVASFFAAEAGGLSANVAARCSADGTWVTLGSHAGVVRLWDLRRQGMADAAKTPPITVAVGSVKGVAHATVVDSSAVVLAVACASQVVVKKWAPP